MNLGAERGGRRWALLAVIGAAATLVALGFFVVFRLPAMAAAALALLLAMAAYLGAHQWLLNQTAPPDASDAQRLLSHFFRATHDVETQPDHMGQSLANVLETAFAPHRAVLSNRFVTATRIASDGASMHIAVPAVPAFDWRARESTTASIVLHHTQPGHPPFTANDAQLAEAVADHLRRAVAYDQAVELGRADERRRLAQDLHDDIGARLLTLMYRAPSPELEDYARHTLQDLKTLTRGLAETNHPLSHALAEWKVEITQRLSAAHIDVKWIAEYDADVVLTFMQWSSVTRVLRELVSNVISHACARAIGIELQLVADQLTLTVTDDGIGRAPQSWSHGLGVGGVRKRVRQLGGEVEWRDHTPRGIQCRVTVHKLSAAR
jgi:signal transduction histidine kinase